MFNLLIKLSMTEKSKSTIVTILKIVIQVAATVFGVNLLS